MMGAKTEVKVRSLFLCFFDVTPFFFFPDASRLFLILLNANDDGDERGMMGFAISPRCEGEEAG